MNGLKRLDKYARENELDLGIRNDVRESGNPEKFIVYSSEWDNGVGSSIDEACEDFISKMISRNEAIVANKVLGLKGARKNLAKVKRI